MTFKRQFLITVFVVLITAIILSALFFYFKKNNFLAHQITHLHEQRKTEFHSIIETRKTLLMAIANSLTLNVQVQKAYREDNRDMLIEHFESLWKTFQKKGLISEIHFFKSPATSFVNFSNLAKYNMDVKDVRQDIDWVSSTFTPSSHYLICRLFPGLRATYPIVIDNTLYGSVSLGINLDDINKYIQEIHPEINSYFLLNDSKLRTALIPDKYKLLVRGLDDFQEFKVFGNKKDISFLDLTQGYVFKDNILYSIFAIKDFNEETIGYFIFEDALSNFITVLFNYTLLYIIMFFFLGCISIYIFWRFLSTHNEDIEHILKLLTALTNKDFTMIKHNKEHFHSSYTELQVIENKIFQTSDDIEMYLELLSKEIKDYSDKALKDVLTDTFNRRALEDIGVKILEKDKLARKATSLVLLDIDNFKSINDTYGHNVGDIVLKQLSEHINKLIRKDDLFVRYGGEEFILLLPCTDAIAAFEVAEKIRLQIANISLDINNIHISFTVSIGVSESSDSNISLSEFIKEADEKLYTAKKNGKNRVVI